MEQREVETRIKALSKAVADKEPASNVIAILDTLKKEVHATEELLRVCPLLRIIRAASAVADTYGSNKNTGYKSRHGRRKAARKPE